MKTFVFEMLCLLLIGPVCAYAQTETIHLERIAAKFQRLRQEAAYGMAKSEEKAARAQQLANLARAKGRPQAERIAMQAAEAAMAAKRRYQANKAKAERALTKVGLYRGREDELRRAEQQLSALQDDVTAIQFALKLYRDSLLQNSSGLDVQARKISRMSDEVLMDGVGYLKDAVAGKVLKDAVKIAKKDEADKIEEFAELLDELKTEKDLAAWLAALPSEKSTLIEGADILAGALVPGWEHVKMNARAWSTVAKECLAWKEINRLNRETEQYAEEVARLSSRMKARVAEIRCLKRCMAEVLIGCTAQCGAKSGSP